MNGPYDPEAARLEMDLDPEVWEQLLTMYRQALPPKFQAIEEAWARQDPAALAPLLHSLRGISLSLAAHGVVRTCAAFEAELKAHILTEDAFRQLRDEVVAVETVLRRISDSDSSPF